MMVTSIPLDPAVEQRLRHLAAHTGRSKACYLRELTANGLADPRTFYLAAATMERVRRGEQRVFT